VAILLAGTARKLFQEGDHDGLLLEPGD
jgi:hypothetical protein